MFIISRFASLSRVGARSGDSTSFQYDSLNRTTSTTTSSGDSYNYEYAGDGQLYKMEDTAAGVAYRYNYDSIGRLIGTNQTGGAADLRAAYGYDNESRLKSINYSIPGVVDSATETFYYNTSTTDSISDGALTSMALFSNSWIYYRYDSLSRLKERDVGGILTEHQTYLAGTNGCTTTTLPETFYTTAKGSSTKLSGFQYAYNEVGNVTQITNLLDNSYWKFAYDKMGQMQYATDYAADGTARGRYKYYYDNAGNLTSWKIQDGSATVTQEEHTYTYGDSNWKDLLTAFDGQTITYDGGGNPLSYYNGQRYTMTWRNGRELNTATVGGKTYSYEYDVNGLRTRKTNSDGGYTQYYIVDGLTVAEQRFTSTGAEKYTLRYLYDESNSPVGFGIQYPSETTWTNYYFAKNLQGDVIALYLWNGTSTGTLVATYKYDPWGKPIGIYNASGATISQTAANVAAYNPFRYRGYRYDADTGFYYLQSRYYDPAICRFINADTYASTGQGFLGHNMFSYCQSNPVVFTDSSGNLIYYTIEETSTVTGSVDPDGSVEYSTKIKYTAIISNPNASFTPDVHYEGEVTFGFNVDQRGVVFFDNSKYEHGMVGDYNISIALANEMYCAATSQVDGALSGRTTKGIARELRMHFQFSAVLPIRKITVADIGGMEKSRSDYDYNAKMFENLWKTPAVIFEMLF